eukprot:jgi/Mesvir1/15964/Mv08278-RA.2
MSSPALGLPQFRRWDRGSTGEFGIGRICPRCCIAFAAFRRTSFTGVPVGHYLQYSSIFAPGGSLTVAPCMLPRFQQATTVCQVPAEQGQTGKSVTSASAAKGPANKGAAAGGAKNATHAAKPKTPAATTKAGKNAKAAVAAPKGARSPAPARPPTAATAQRVLAGTARAREAVITTTRGLDAAMVVSDDAPTQGVGSRLPWSLWPTGGIYGGRRLVAEGAPLMVAPQGVEASQSVVAQGAPGAPSVVVRDGTGEAWRSSADEGSPLLRLSVKTHMSSPGAHPGASTSGGNTIVTDGSPLAYDTAVTGLRARVGQAVARRVASAHARAGSLRVRAIDTLRRAKRVAVRSVAVVADDPAGAARRGLAMASSSPLLLLLLVLFLLAAHFRNMAGSRLGGARPSLQQLFYRRPSSSWSPGGGGDVASAVPPITPGATADAATGSRGEALRRLAAAGTQGTAARAPASFLQQQIAIAQGKPPALPHALGGATVEVRGLVTRVTPLEPGGASRAPQARAGDAAVPPGPSAGGGALGPVMDRMMARVFGPSAANASSATSAPAVSLPLWGSTSGGDLLADPPVASVGDRSNEVGRGDTTGATGLAAAPDPFASSVQAGRDVTWVPGATGVVPVPASPGERLRSQMSPLAADAEDAGGDGREAWLDCGSTGEPSLPEWGKPEAPAGLGRPGGIALRAPGRVSVGTDASSRVAAGSQDGPTVSKSSGVGGNGRVGGAVELSPSLLERALAMMAERDAQAAGSNTPSTQPEDLPSGATSGEEGGAATRVDVPGGASASHAERERLMEMARREKERQRLRVLEWERERERERFWAAQPTQRRDPPGGPAKPGPVSPGPGGSPLMPLERGNVGTSSNVKPPVDKAGGQGRGSSPSPSPRLIPRAAEPSSPGIVRVPPNEPGSVYTSGGAGDEQGGGPVIFPARLEERREQERILRKRQEDLAEAYRKRREEGQRGGGDAPRLRPLLEASKSTAHGSGKLQGAALRWHWRRHIVACPRSNKGFGCPWLRGVQVALADGRWICPAW